MPDFLYRLPLPLAAFIVIACLCLYSILGMLATRRWILPRLLPDDGESDFNGAMLQAVMVFYGLAVALIAVSVWETHAEVSSTVSHEASRIAGLYRDVSSYPEPKRAELQNELKGYTDYLIEVAWPMQQIGVYPTKGVHWLNRFQSSLSAFEPSNESQKALHAETLAAFNRLIDARRHRLDSMLVRLPPILWFIIHFGAVVSLASAFFFRVRDVKLHSIQLTLLSIFIGLVVTLILAFDRPFIGDLAIDAGSYQLIREQIMDL
jgi:hypothetical protein